MAAQAINLSQWQEVLKDKLAPRVRSLFEGGARRQLLKQIDRAFLVFDNRLVCLASGAKVELELAECHSAEELARACAALLKDDTEASVLLLLPPGEFVATSISLPALSREALLSALRLQTDVLLPGIDEKLAVAVNTLASANQHVALWVSEARLDALYAEFEKRGIFLCAIMPRNIFLLPASGTAVVQESDNKSITRITGENGCLLEWLHVDKMDLQQDAFLQQWQQAKARTAAETSIECDDESAYPEQQIAGSVKEYYFFPRGALNAERKLEKGKRFTLAGIAALILVFLGSLPFLWQFLELRSLSGRLATARELSIGPREDSAVVQNFENTWGVVNDYPEQNIREVLFTLQNILSPERLSSFEIASGLIKIEGESTEPQAILQRLDQDPMFTEVAFSRATSNSLYYIDLRLSAVNFEGYMVRYFPDN